MRHLARQANERAHAAEAFAEREVLPRRHELRRFLDRAVELERHHAAKASHLLFRDGMARMAGEAGEVDALDARMRHERFRDLLRVHRVPFHPELQRLETAQRQPAIERARHAAQCILQKPDRLEHRRVSRNHRALNQIRVSRQVLRHAVQHEVGAQIERLLKVRRREGVVDNDERAFGVRELRDRADVIHEQPRVGRRLEPHERRLRADHALDRGEIAEVHVLHDAADRLEHFVEHAERAAVHILRHDDFSAGLEIRLEDRVLRREA